MTNHAYNCRFWCIFSLHISYKFQCIFRSIVIIYHTVVETISYIYLFWCNISKNKVNSSMFSICNPHFGTIENVIVSLLFSFCFQGKSITSWAYFWQAKTSNLKIKYAHIIIKSSLVGQRKITVQIYQLILKSKISLIWARKFQT